MERGLRPKRFEEPNFSLHSTGSSRFPSPLTGVPSANKRDERKPPKMRWLEELHDSGWRLWKFGIATPILFRALYRYPSALRRLHRQQATDDPAGVRRRSVQVVGCDQIKCEFIGCVNAALFRRRICEALTPSHIAEARAT